MSRTSPHPRETGEIVVLISDARRHERHSGADPVVAVVLAGVLCSGSGSHDLAPGCVAYRTR